MTASNNDAMLPQKHGRKEDVLQQKLLCGTGILVAAFFVLTMVFWACHLQREVATLEEKLRINKAAIERLSVENDFHNEETDDDYVYWPMEDDQAPSRIKRSIQTRRTKRHSQHCHLNGLGEGRYHESRSGLRGNEFIWDHNSDTCNMDVRDHATKIIINEKGFYFVYAQLVFYAKGEEEIAFQVIKKSKNDDYDILTMSVTTPNRLNLRNGEGNAPRHAYSGYTGGLFQLKPGDVLYVEPKERPIGVVYRMNEKETFFGMFKVKI